MRLLTERAEFLVECLDLPKAAEFESAVWEDFQIAHLNDDSTFRIEDKSRQIAWSFTVAAEAMATAILTGQGTIFVSINQEEAAEKIRYAKIVYENLGIGGLPKITVDNALGLELENRGRLLSLPSRPPRGKARMNVVLDELAHTQKDREIYTAAPPIISKGGRLRIGSSPMGATGIFWEISRQQLRAYPGYTRVQTPWWKVKAFTRKEAVGAQWMETAERVHAFGNKRIQDLYENMPLEDFQQEYECVFVDEAVSYFTWDEIRNAQDANLLCHHVKDPDALDDLVLGVKREIAAGKVENVLVGGFDVGRKKHLSEIIVLGLGAGGKLPIRLMLSLDKIKFDVQERCVRTLLGRLPFASFLIDRNGLGMQLAENLEGDTIAEGVTFTNATKSMWASQLKIQFERDKLVLPPNRDLAYQIHSIKKIITNARNVILDTDKAEKHHGDKAWALALACWAAKDLASNQAQMGAIPAWKRT